MKGTYFWGFSSNPKLQGHNTNNSFNTTQFSSLWESVTFHHTADLKWLDLHYHDQYVKCIVMNWSSQVWTLARCYTFDPCSLKGRKYGYNVHGFMKTAGEKGGREDNKGIFIWILLQWIIALPYGGLSSANHILSFSSNTHLLTLDHPLCSPQRVDISLHEWKTWAFPGCPARLQLCSILPSTLASHPHQVLHPLTGPSESPYQPSSSLPPPPYSTSSPVVQSPKKQTNINSR